MEVIENAIKQGRTTLSEYESKQILTSYRIPVTRDVLVHDVNDLLTKTELKIEKIFLQNANLTDIAAKAAEILGLNRDEVFRGGRKRPGFRGCNTLYLSLQNRYRVR